MDCYAGGVTRGVAEYPPRQVSEAVRRGQIPHQNFSLFRIKVPYHFAQLHPRILRATLYPMPSNELTTTVYPATFKLEEFLEYVASGESESSALALIGFSPSAYTLMLIRNQDFQTRLQEAFKARAQVWHSKIIQNASKAILDPKEVPGAKLQFDQLKYLAEKDDPDRYGEKRKIETSTTISIMDFRNMSDKQAQQILTNNPFANVEEAEFTEIYEPTDSTEAL